METRLSSKGQITLPSEVRRRLKIRTGDVLVVKTVGENSIILEVKRKDFVTTTKQEEDILTATAGLWRDRNDITENFIRELRQSDLKRLEELLNEQHSN
ncbi:MAG: AbrB/MazE/SpoVT family DNA-binding domain-containing protein [Firmicutes bacterium]|nr:AbrB/MazE/SpoVT family DNA-binding domain-containing protein [Bacillota bacterium]